MEAQDGGYQDQSQNGDDSSPGSHKSRLQLPMSCDPPGPGNPAKQLVWIVSSPKAAKPMMSPERMLPPNEALLTWTRYSVALDTWDEASSDHV